mmetsp:Transcript_30318/g.64362  ORF Transcript_30318/g.64362 Transcript_30318/m.64362 type:complete len:247 (-) Transcript_30318:50-790(-)
MDRRSSRVDARGSLEGWFVRLLPTRAHSPPALERVALSPDRTGADHASSQTHLVRQRGRIDRTDRRNLPHAALGHHLGLHTQVPLLSVDWLQRGLHHGPMGGPSDGGSRRVRPERPQARRIRQRALLDADDVRPILHGVPVLPRRQDPRTHPLEVFHPRDELPGVRGLLLRGLVHLLHGGADGEAHGRLRDVRGALLQRDGAAVARSLRVGDGAFSPAFPPFHCERGHCLNLKHYRGRGFMHSRLS